VFQVSSAVVGEYLAHIGVISILSHGLGVPSGRLELVVAGSEVAHLDKSLPSPEEQGRASQNLGRAGRVQDEGLGHIIDAIFRRYLFFSVRAAHRVGRHRDHLTPRLNFAAGVLDRQIVARCAAHRVLPRYRPRGARLVCLEAPSSVRSTHDHVVPDVALASHRYGLGNIGQRRGRNSLHSLRVLFECGDHLGAVCSYLHH